MVSLPIKNHSTVDILGSCRGFIVFDKYPHFIVWNPSTGAHKRISYSHTVSFANSPQPLSNTLLSGFGYDTSNDDYLMVLAWRDLNKEHFQFFSMRTNSWKDFEVALPNSLLGDAWRRGFLLNGSFYWLAFPCHPSDPILVFDLNERSFSEIPVPEGVEMSGHCRIMELGGCLASCFVNNLYKLEIWLMKKEYKVQPSWLLYGIFDLAFQPMCVSNDGNIIGLDKRAREISKYNVSGKKLENSSFGHGHLAMCTMYAESLLSLPDDSEDKKKGLLSSSRQFLTT